ncbi:MAG TPA: flagellar basal body-associated FliL family protein [Steroidobacteraceae bacterium]|nr:flagellar basal body-associated FliL family protein [Steroidobacteraceae bacterium]
MAAQIPVLEAADKTAAAPQAKGRGKLLLIIVILTAIVLLGAGVGAAWWLTSGKHPAAAAAKEPQAAPPPPAGPPLFLALDPPFVVNFDAEQAVRFLQIAVQLETRDPATVELLKTNDPVVRNDLLLLFANQKYTQLSTREGKEALRTQALESVRKVLGQAGGHPERLEAVYFTSFVMQ